MRCCALLEGRGYFRDCVIFVDSFMTFMAGEKKLLQLMLAECERMEVSLPLDALPEMDDGQPLSDGTFSVARETFLQMLGWAKDQQIPYDCPDPLPQSPRFQNEALRFLEKQCHHHQPPILCGGKQQGDSDPGGQPLRGGALHRRPDHPAGAPGGRSLFADRGDCPGHRPLPDRDRGPLSKVRHPLLF